MRSASPLPVSECFSSSPQKSKDRVDATKQLEFALDMYIDHLFLELKAANIHEDTGGCMVQRNESKYYTVVRASV